MEKINTNTTKMFGETDFANLRNALPGKYYPDFVNVWANKYGKKAKCPSKQHVYVVLSGKSDNDKILEILIELVEKRNELKEKLNSATRHVREPETATAD
jgi:hypothetical protein